MQASPFQTTVSRHANYGHLQLAPRSDAADLPADPALASFQLAQALLAQAIQSGKLEKPYVDVDSRHRGSALNYDLYDIKGASVLIQSRHTTCTKWGNSPKKDYLLLRKMGRGVTVIDMNESKPVIVKLAKASDGLGDVIDALSGKKPIKIRPNLSAPRIGYKIVKVNEAGDYVSVWDDSPWPIGRQRTQAATSNHSGGFYYFRTLDECLTVHAKRGVFGDYHDGDERFVIIECEAAGAEYEHDSGKRCVTRLKPLAAVCSLL